MRGTKGPGPIYDEYRREPMDWFASETGRGMPTWFRLANRNNKPDDGISVEEQDADPASLLNYYRALVNSAPGRPPCAETTSSFWRRTISAPAARPASACGAGRVQTSCLRSSTSACRLRPPRSTWPPRPFRSPARRQPCWARAAQWTGSSSRQPALRCCDGAGHNRAGQRSYVCGARYGTIQSPHHAGSRFDRAMPPFQGGSRVGAGFPRRSRGLSPSAPSGPFGEFTPALPDQTLPT